MREWLRGRCLRAGGCEEVVLYLLGEVIAEGVLIAIEVIVNGRDLNALSSVRHH